MDNWPTIKARVWERIREGLDKPVGYVPTYPDISFSMRDNAMDLFFKRFLHEVKEKNPSKIAVTHWFLPAFDKWSLEQGPANSPQAPNGPLVMVQFPDNGEFELAYTFYYD